MCVGGVDFESTFFIVGRTTYKSGTTYAVSVELDLSPSGHSKIVYTVINKCGAFMEIGRAHV